MQPEEYLVFDIETVPMPWDDFSESQQEFILRRAGTDEEKEQKLREMALSPMTAKVICIGLQHILQIDEDEWDTKNCKAFSVDESLGGDEVKNITLESGSECQLSSEKRLLEDFWKILNKYANASLVSFNGRNFDNPFLMLRSALLKIRPSRNIMSGTKFNYNKHIDLIDELSFFNTSQYSAARRFNFDFYTRAFGITSPKSEGIDGSKVAEFFEAGKIADISEYCLRDVRATWDLFLIWRKYLRF